MHNFTKCTHNSLILFIGLICCDAFSKNKKNNLYICEIWKLFCFFPPKILFYDIILCALWCSWSIWINHVLRDTCFMVPVLFYTVGYHWQLQMPAWPCCLHQKNNYMARIIRESERGRKRGGVGGKGRVLRDRMSRKICQIHCFFTEALTPRIITPGKPRNSPLNQVILLIFPITKAYELNLILLLLPRKDDLVK